MDAHWRAFGDELARWQDGGRTLDFWWRDDDACRAHPAYARLLDLVAGAGVPLGLAVIPEDADAGLVADLPPSVAVLQHGCDHRNRAPAGGKKSEFPDTESQEAALSRLVDARQKLVALSGGRNLPVLVPPWNRLDEALVARLPGAGFVGLSRFGASATRGTLAALRQVNTHIDIIDWQGSRGFAGDACVLAQATQLLAARRASGATADEPIGWLTHHLVHDAAAWDFLVRLFAMTRGLPGVRWRHPADLFTSK